MVEASDEDLMNRFVRGDEAAFEALYGRYAKSVHGFIARMVRDGALAEDLLQTTFMSVLRSKDRYEQGLPFRPWLLTIAANATRDALRRGEKSRPPRDGEAQAPEASVEQAPSDVGARRQILSALASLPVQQREAVLLHKVEGLSFEQIAEVLGVTSTAARIRAHRGYEKLRGLLAHLEAE